MAYDNQQAYYQSLVQAGNDPNASAEAKGNAAWAQAQSDYNSNYDGGTTAPTSSSSSSSPSSSSSSYSGPATVIGNTTGSKDANQATFNDAEQQLASHPEENAHGVSTYSDNNNGNVYDTTNMTAQQIYALSMRGNPNAGKILSDMGLDINGNPIDAATANIYRANSTGGGSSNPSSGGGGSSIGGGGGGYGPSQGQQAAYALFGANYTPSSTNSQGFNPSAASQAAMNALTGTAANGQPSYSQQLMDSYNKLASSLDPTSSYWDAYHNTANTLGQTIYNTQKQGYQNTINQLNQAKQNELNVGQNALTDKSFQNYLNMRQVMGNRGQLDSGLNADANYRLQLANAQNLQNLYSRADATYDPRIADANAKMNILSPDQIAAQQFMNMFNSASKNNATALRNSAQTLGKVMPYDFTSQADQLKNSQAYEKMGVQNNQFLDSLQQKYASLNQKSQSDAVNQLMGYDKNSQNNQTKTSIDNANNQLNWQKWITPSGNNTQNNATNQWKWQTPSGNNTQDNQTKTNIANADNNTKQMIAQYPYLYQTINNKADNATKAAIADELAKNNWNIAQLSNQTKWKLGEMANAFNYDKLGAEVRNWAEQNKLKRSDLSLRADQLSEKNNYDNAMIDKASQAAKDGETKTKLQSLKDMANFYNERIRSKMSMGGKVDTSDPDVQQFNNVQQAITDTLQGVDKYGGSSSAGTSLYPNEYNSDGIDGGMPPQ